MANNIERDAEIADLKTHIASLERRLAKLEPKPEPASPPRENRPVTITPVASLVASSSLPTEDEAAQLLDKLRERFPIFHSAWSTTNLSEAQQRRQFINAFRFVVSAYKRDQVNEGIDGLGWIMRARSLARY